MSRLRQVSRLLLRGNNRCGSQQSRNITYYNFATYNKHKPTSSEVLTRYLSQCNEPPWTSYFVKYSSVKDDQWGKSHFNWTVGQSNYHILRTGCFPYMKYHCTKRAVQDLTIDDYFFRCIKVLNLGIPCLAYGLAAMFLIKHTEQVNTSKGIINIYFLYPEDKGYGKRTKHTNNISGIAMLKRTLLCQWKNSRRNIASTASTVDNLEIQHFEKFLSEWWNEFGPMKPLHAMNKLRIPFVRDGLVNSGTISSKKIHDPKILKGLSLLDVGCGGGILSEPLARLGGNVTGIDANPNIVELAKSHAELNHLDIKYSASSIEEHATENKEAYDAIVASEVLEHIVEKEKFLDACIKCLRPTGSIFITTINKTILANITGIFLSENVFNLLPKGTHQYEKFLEPVKLRRILEDNNCRTELLHGMFYNVFTNTWHWCSDTSVCYALQAIKLKVSDN